MHIQQGDNLIVIQEVVTANVAAPKYTPSKSAGMCKGTVKLFQNIKNKLVYIWLKNGKEFWFFSIENKNNIVTGYAWMEKCKKWNKVNICIDNLKTYC